MPIRGYFLIIGPALLAFLWLVGWYLEPNRPAQPAVAAQSINAAAPKAQTVGVASPATAAELPVAAAATTTQPMPDLRASTETKPADEIKPVKTAARPKKRKQFARRPAPARDGYAASGYASPYSGYGGAYRSQPSYAGGYQPFFRW